MFEPKLAEVSLVLFRKGYSQ